MPEHGALAFAAMTLKRLPRWVVVLAVLAVCSVSIYLAGVSETKTTTRTTRDAIRATQLGQCARGNALRAALRLRDPRVGRLLEILDCRPTIIGHRAAPLNAAAQASFVVEVRACADAPRPSRWCFELMNGPLDLRSSRGDVGGQ